MCVPKEAPHLWLSIQKLFWAWVGGWFGFGGGPGVRQISTPLPLDKHVSDPRNELYGVASSALSDGGHTSKRVHLQCASWLFRRTLDDELPDEGAYRNPQKMEAKDIAFLQAHLKGFPCLDNLTLSLPNLKLLKGLDPEVVMSMASQMLEQCFEAAKGFNARKQYVFMDAVKVAPLPWAPARRAADPCPAERPPECHISPVPTHYHTNPWDGFG